LGDYTNVVDRSTEKLSPPSRVQAALRARGITAEVRQFPDSTRTAAEAAAAIGTTVGQIVKSLVFLSGTEPVLALVSDGVPTDDWKAGLKAIDATPWGRKAVRVAIAIGTDADRGVLQEFLGNPELQPLDANSPKQLAAAIRWASTAAVKAASQPVAGEGPTLTKQPFAPPVIDDDDDDDVW